MTARSVFRVRFDGEGGTGLTSTPQQAPEQADLLPPSTPVQLIDPSGAATADLPERETLIRLYRAMVIAAGSTRRSQR